MLTTSNANYLPKINTLPSSYNSLKNLYLIVVYINIILPLIINQYEKRFTSTFNFMLF